MTIHGILAETLDVILASDFEMSIAATTLEISATQLVKIIAHDNAALKWLNDARKDRGLSTLKT